LQHLGDCWWSKSGIEKQLVHRRVKGSADIYKEGTPN
jgi:hypothetical protein